VLVVALGLVRARTLCGKIRRRSADAGAVDPPGAMAASFSRRISVEPRHLLRRAQRPGHRGVADRRVFAALAEIGHARFVALMFAGSLALLMASLVELTREIRVHMANIHLE